MSLFQPGIRDEGAKASETQCEGQQIEGIVGDRALLGSSRAHLL